MQDKRKDRKSTRLNSSHQIISYAVFCLKKKKKRKRKKRRKKKKKKDENEQRNSVEERTNESEMNDDIT